ncbi:DUF3147 family protein [Candidatus Peregrinibacteria bacterium]|nr:DUF3147 family protein [Candidatus Peregrinibacteria bacterium]
MGGIVIALLSFFAERANKKIAGIVLSLPSTVVIGYFFIGWATSAEAIFDIAPTTIATDGSVLFFAIVYIYLSKIKTNKITSILISTTLSLLTWFILSIPLAIIKFDNLLLSLVLYLIPVMVSYYFLSYKNKVEKNSEKLTYSNFQKIARAIFAGLIISLSVYLSKMIHPFWGGIFSGFPAAFLSTFIILHWYYGSQMLFKIAKTIPAGSIVFIIYILAARYTFSSFGIIGGTILAYLISLISFFILIKIQNRKK